MIKYALWIVKIEGARLRGRESAACQGVGRKRRSQERGGDPDCRASAPPTAEGVAVPWSQVTRASHWHLGI